MVSELKFDIIDVKVPEGCNIVFGVTHFIKSVEDIYEAVVNSVPRAKFGIAFAEASGPCLIRCEGTDEELKKIAAENLFKIGCGHTFLIVMKDMYPINIMDKIKNVPEVCTVLAATANPVQVVVVETAQGRGVVAVIDGYKSKGIEGEKEVRERREFLRKIGYKFQP